MKYRKHPPRYWDYSTNWGYPAYNQGYDPLRGTYSITQRRTKYGGTGPSRAFQHRVRVLRLPKGSRVRVKRGDLLRRVLLAAATLTLTKDCSPVMGAPQLRGRQA